MISELSKAGKYHLGNDEYNQDVVLSDENEYFSVITLTDGVSQCNRAGQGARIAGEAITDLLIRKGGYFLGFEKEKTADFIVSHILYEIKEMAENDGQDFKEYSSTVASVLLEHNSGKMMYFNLGDGMIMTTCKNDLSIIAMPYDSRNGCCVTTTENAALAVDTGIINASGLDSVIICSDGAWSSMFEKNRLNGEAREALMNRNYDKLGDFLKSRDISDDYSFISMDLKKIYGREKM